MKKFILVLLCMMTLAGCEKTVPSANMDISVPEEKKVVERLPETTKETFEAVTDIEVSEPDKTYYLNSKKIMFFDDKGR